jgi:phage terminase small subunit
MKEKMTNRELEILQDLLATLPQTKSAVDRKLLEALAVETALYEEATLHVAKRKVITEGVKVETQSAWVTIRNNALKNMQNITRLLGISELSKMEAPVAKVAKLDLLKNGKNKIQKTGS